MAPTRTNHPFLVFELPEIRAAKEGSIAAKTPTSISLLTRRLAKGDEAAFREFHELYFAELYQFLLVVARGQEHEAQEALQETMLRVARYAREFETEEAFLGWLKVVARSAARDRGRKHLRYLAALKNFALHWAVHEPQPGGEEDQVVRNLLEESLGELDAEDRLLIEGKYLGDETVKELSSKTGLTDRAVESRLLRLRRRLQERILTKLRNL